MKKALSVLLFLLVLISFSACSNDSEEETTTQMSTVIYTTQQTIETTTQLTTVPATTKKAEQTTVAPQSQISEQTTQSVVTYYSDNPNNSYICKVADKFSSDKSNLIALIRVNSSTPGATVLEFTGARDSSGQLITTIDELKFIYDVFDNGTIRRASRNASENISYNSITSAAAFMLAEKYMLPNLDTMRTNRRYENFY